MTHERDYTLTRDDEGIDLTIEYAVTRFYPAQTYGPPENCSPAEGGEITEFAAFRDGEPFDLTHAEQDKIEAWIYETHEYDDGDYWEE